MEITKKKKKLEVFTILKNNFLLLKASKWRKNDFDVVKCNAHFRIGFFFFFLVRIIASQLLQSLQITSPLLHWIIYITEINARFCQYYWLHFCCKIDIEVRFWAILEISRQRTTVNFVEFFFFFLGGGRRGSNGIREKR